MVRTGRLFDAVLLDPPKFIIGRDGYEEGIKKYPDLNMLGLQCVRPGGLFVTCSCSGLLLSLIHIFPGAVRWKKRFSRAKFRMMNPYEEPNRIES